MRIEYDSQADALYIHLLEVTVYRTVELSEGLNIDLDEKGRLIGIEILDALDRYSPQEIFNIDIEQLVVTEDVLVVEAKAPGK